MRSPTKQAGSDRRSTERRAEPAQAVKGERRVVEQRGVVTSMVDALEDILKWERASERAIRIAASASVGAPSTPDLDVSTN
jgi:hypothetical protein